MENKKCSSKEHIETDAISYCYKCEIYMCNKCDKLHMGLCPNHGPYNLNKEKKEKFSGFCKEENHFMKLEYFCKEHNQLCCAGCLCKMKNKGNGQHANCNVCNIEDIKNEKLNQLTKNMKILEDLSKNLENSIDELKQLYDKGYSFDELEAKVPHFQEYAGKFFWLWLSYSKSQ